MVIITCFVSFSTILACIYFSKCRLLIFLNQFGLQKSSYTPTLTDHPDPHPRWNPPDLFKHQNDCKEHRYRGQNVKCKRDYQNARGRLLLRFYATEKNREKKLRRCCNNTPLGLMRVN